MGDVVGLIIYGLFRIRGGEHVEQQVQRRLAGGDGIGAVVARDVRQYVTEQFALAVIQEIGSGLGEQLVRNLTLHIGTAMVAHERQCLSGALDVKFVEFHHANGQL